MYLVRDEIKNEQKILLDTVLGRDDNHVSSQNGIESRCKIRGLQWIYLVIQDRDSIYGTVCRDMLAHPEVDPTSCIRLLNSSPCAESANSPTKMLEKSMWQSFSSSEKSDAISACLQSSAKHFPTNEP